MIYMIVVKLRNIYTILTKDQAGWQHGAKLAKNCLEKAGNFVKNVRCSWRL